MSVTYPGTVRKLQWSIVCMYCRNTKSHNFSTFRHVKTRKRRNFLHVEAEKSRP